jgi:hypothetical protein
LGLIAYTMLVGKPYWLEETMRAGAALAFALHACKGPQESPVKRASFYGTTLPPAFDEWFFRVCAARTEDRPQVATAAVIELAQVLGVSMQVDSAPLSMPRSGGAGRATLGGSTNISSILTGSGVGALPPMRAPQGSIPGTNTPLQPVLTLSGSGLTNAGSPARNNKFLVAIIAGAAVTLLVAGFVAYQVLSTSSVSTTAEPAAASPATSSNSLVPKPDVQPVGLGVVADAPSAAPADASSTTTKTTKTTATTTTATTTTTVRPTATPTSTGKKPPGGNIWNND